MQTLSMEKRKLSGRAATMKSSFKRRENMSNPIISGYYADPDIRYF